MIMKRIIALVLVFMLTCSAFAEIDLSKMSTKKLQKLRDKIDAELESREKTNPVTVPVGVWVVGEDIPLGHWQITVANNAPYGWASVTYCGKLDVTGKKPKIGGPDNFYYAEQIKQPGSDASVQLESLDLDLQEKGYIIVKYGDVIFTPFKGKKNLGF
jgi:hypothetical protein